MKKTAYILIALLFFYGSLSSQELTKDYIDNWILKTFPSAEIDTTVLYVVNGYLFDYKNITRELSKYSKQELFGIDFFDKNMQKDPFHGQISNVVLINIGQERRKIIRRKLEKVVSTFALNEDCTVVRPNTEIPVLMINDMIIPPSDCCDTITDLKARKIRGINIVNRPVSQEYYGDNGKNGLIMIKLK